MHLVTAMLWVGGVLTLAIVVWPLAPALRRAAFLRFSRIAIAARRGAGRRRARCVAIQRLPALSDLWQTSYGRTLLVKIGARARRARLGGHAPPGRPAAARARRRGQRESVEPARRDDGRDGGAARRGRARQRRAATRRDAGPSGRPGRRTVGSTACSSRSPAARASSACTSPGASSPTATPCGRSTSRRSRTRARGRGGASSAATCASRSTRARLVAGADVLVHAAAALPIQQSRTGDPLGERRRRRGDLSRPRSRRGRPGRADLVDGGLRRPGAASDRRGRPARRASGLTARRRSRPSVSAARSHAVAWSRWSSGRRRSSGPSASGCSRSSSTGSARGGGSRSSATAEPLPAARGRGPLDAVVRCLDAPVAGEALNVGAARFGTVREDLGALIDHAGSASRLRPVPARPAEVALRALELARLSPLAEWHYRTAHRDSVRLDRQGAAHCSAGSRDCRTPRRSARRTTGTSATERSCARPARRTAFRGTSARSASSDGSRSRSHGTSTSAPRIVPARTRASASFACSSGTASTSVRTWAVGATARNSSPSARVRFATERTTRSPHRSS